MVKPNIAKKSLKTEITISPDKVINIDRLYNLYFDKSINNCFKEFPNVAKINNLINIFEKENKVGLASLRTIFKDFNPIFQSEQIAFLKIPKAMFPQETSAICNDKGPRKRDYQKNWKNMCFYCGTPILSDQEKQCDHVIDILNTYVSIKPSVNFYRNFQFVHKKCNSKASNNNLQWIWNTVGNLEYFPPPLPNYTEQNFCVSQLLPSISITPENIISYNSAICRYYLFENILQYLEPWSMLVYQQRKDSIQKIYSEYQTFLQTAQLNLNISPQISAANILREMQSKISKIPAKQTIKFKKDIKNKKKTLKKKKSLSPSLSQLSPVQASYSYP